jgi:hypothetical protein
LDRSPPIVTIYVRKGGEKYVSATLTNFGLSCGIAVAKTLRRINRFFREVSHDLNGNCVGR